MAIKQFGGKPSRLSGETMADPVQKIVVIFTDKSDSDNEDGVVVNMEDDSNLSSGDSDSFYTTEDKKLK